VDGGGTATYTYDSLNQRVQIAPSRGTYEFVWDIFGRRVSNWSASSHTLVESNAYTDSGPIAIRGGGTRIYESQNWLGTERVRTTYNGAVSISIASLPWADQHTPAGDNGDQHDFAGMDRDLEDATEHAQYRQFSTNLGRWLSPDQYLGSYDFSNPQSFNRYSYALNDPVNLVDPSGLTITCTTNSDGSRSCIDDQGSNNSDCASNYTACANVPPGCVAYGTEGCITGDNPGSSSPLAPVPTQQSSGGSGSQIGSAPNNGTPVHGPWTYGNFCGAGGMGTPINGTDAACQTHDACYNQAGFSPGSNYQGSNTQLQACNQQLCNAVRASNQSLIQQADSLVQHTSRGSSPMGGFSPAQAGQFQANSDINLFFTWLVAPGNSCHLP
jgi:RHS repeat-associated protein